MNDVINGWDNAAAKYLEAQERSEYVEINKKTVKNRFKQLCGERLLDLGCGYGCYTDYFRTIGAHAVGIDGSEKMIELAKERYPLTEFSVMDIAMPLAFGSNEFDIVFINQVLMDIENIGLVFSECNRLLKSGGILYYSIVHPAFYDGCWLGDETGYLYAKRVERYIAPYQCTNEFWGETKHFHRSLSYYLNIAAENGFVLRHTDEPVSYDGKSKNSDIPLFFFAEYIKASSEI